MCQHTGNIENENAEIAMTLAENEPIKIKKRGRKLHENLCVCVLAELFDSLNA